MLMVLGLIDVVMIANLLNIVIIGDYETFVSRLALESHPDQPEWLSHVNAGVLKVKLATALMGIRDSFAQDLHQCRACARKSNHVAGDHSHDVRIFGPRDGVYRQDHDEYGVDDEKASTGIATRAGLSTHRHTKP
ncbi:MAG: YqhA family protein [Chromatiales bacterium]